MGVAGIVLGTIRRRESPNTIGRRVSSESSTRPTASFATTDGATEPNSGEHCALMARGGRKFPCDTCTVAETSIPTRGATTMFAGTVHAHAASEARLNWPVDFFQEHVQFCCLKLSSPTVPARPGRLARELFPGACASRFWFLELSVFFLKIREVVV